MMKAMRRKNYQTTTEQAYTILQNCKYLAIAMLNEDGSPYNVVVETVCDQGKVYFHCATEGQKLDCIRHDPRICATGVADAVRVPEKATTQYASVTLHGKARILTDPARKEAVIRKHSQQFGVTPENIQAILDRSFASMAMVEIEIEEITGKNSMH